jgi:hypothetical protein
MALIFGTNIQSSQHRLNTTFIERVNLTLRQRVSALIRRRWSTAQLAPQLLVHLEWWRASSHFARPHEG